MIGCKRKDLNIRGVPDFGLGAGGGDGQGADLQEEVTLFEDPTAIGTYEGEALGGELEGDGRLLCTPGWLSLSAHQNAVFNCCPGTLGADVSMEGKSITIGEYESASNCDCNCTYDLSYEIGPLTEDETYTISIGHKGLES